MATNELDKVISLINNLSEKDRQKLAQYLNRQTAIDYDAEDLTFAEEEIEEMMIIQPARGREIVQEGLKSGAIGSWADMGITDPVEWLSQQRANRFQW